MREKTGGKKKKIQNKINSNKKKGDHIWHKNKSKSYRGMKLKTKFK
jgi:hypothetical protein